MCGKAQFLVALNFLTSSLFFPSALKEADESIKKKRVAEMSE